MRTINIHVRGPSGPGKTVFTAAMYRQFRIKRASSARPAEAKPLPARPNSVSLTRWIGNQPAYFGSGYRCPVVVPGMRLGIMLPHQLASRAGTATAIGLASLTPWEYRNEVNRCAITCWSPTW